MYRCQRSRRQVAGIPPGRGTPETHSVDSTLVFKMRRRRSRELTGWRTSQNESQIQTVPSRGAKSGHFSSVDARQHSSSGGSRLGRENVKRPLGEEHFSSGVSRLQREQANLPHKREEGDRLVSLKHFAPAVGLEPTTSGLTVCSEATGRSTTAENGSFGNRKAHQATSAARCGSVENRAERSPATVGAAPSGSGDAPPMEVSSEALLGDLREALLREDWKSLGRVARELERRAVKNSESPQLNAQRGK